MEWCRQGWRLSDQSPVRLFGTCTACKMCDDNRIVGQYAFDHLVNPLDHTQWSCALLNARIQPARTHTEHAKTHCFGISNAEIGGGAEQGEARW